jgi:hypothetical protein
MTPTQRIAAMLMGEDESEAQEARYLHERAAKDAEQRVAQLQGRKPPRHDANEIETLIRALMR